MLPIFRRHTVLLSVAGKSLLVGILALQGDVREHELTLDALGVSYRRVRTAPDLVGIDGLIIPGGESTVIDKLSRIFGIRDEIRRRISAGMPVFGTCAGLIMLSERLSDAIADQETFGGLDVTVRRNAFGSQTASFETFVSAPEVTARPIEVAFIRAPVVESVGEGVRVLAALPSGEIVAVREGSVLGISCHPEITGDTAFHDYFLTMVRDQAPH